MTANILKKHLLDNKAEHCENPLACCLDFKPIDVLVDDILTELEQNRLHTAIELHALQKQRGYILGKANKKLDTEIGQVQTIGNQTKEIRTMEEFTITQVEDWLSGNNWLSTTKLTEVLTDLLKKCHNV